MKSLNMKVICRVFSIFAFLTALNLSPFIFTGALPGAPDCDTLVQFIPFYSFGIHRMAQGIFPQNVPVFSGHDIASFGQGYVYPTFFVGILLGIPVVVFFLFDLWLHWSLSGMAMTLYCLRIKLPLIPAVLAGCVYIFSAPVMWRFYGHWTFIHQIAFYPLVLLLTEELIHPRWFKSRARLIGFGGLLMGLLLLAQNIQILYYLCFTQIPYLCLRLVFKKNKDKWRAPLFTGMGVVLLGLLFSSAYFLPIIMSFKRSFRYLITGANFADSFSLEFTHLYSLFYPGFFFCDKAYWGRWYASESLISAGSAVMFMAYLGIPGIIRMRSNFRLVMPALFFLVAGIMGFGKEVPWFDFLVNRIPLYSSFRSHGRVGLLIIMALAVLSAEGCAVLLRLHRFRKSQRIFWTFSALGALFLALFSFYVMLRLNSPVKVALWIQKCKFQIPRIGSDQSEGLKLIFRSVRNSILPVVLFSFLVLLLSLLGILKPRSCRTIVFLLCVVLLAGFLSDFTFHRKLILGSKSPPLQTIIPEAIDRKLNDISRFPFDPGRLCIVSRHPFQIINLLYPNLETASGLDGNLSRDYGVHLNKIQGLPLNSYQLGTNFVVLSPRILDDLAVRWILIDRALLPVTRLSPQEWRLAAEGGDFFLVEYLGWKGKISLDGEARAGVDIIRHTPDYVSVKVSGQGRKDITLKNVNSPSWRAYFQGEPVSWEKKGPWMKVGVSGQGILEFRFCNVPLRTGICLSFLGAILTGILLGYPWKGNKAAPLL